MKIKKINLCLENEIISTGVEIKNGKIFSFDCKDGEDYANYFLIPGLIDQHIHGVNGSDIMDATSYSIENIASSLLKEGTTSFLATTMTDTKSNILNAINNVVNSNFNEGANILGIHLEGPFINKLKKGAQNEISIINPSIDFINDVNIKNSIKIITIAPELDDALDVIKQCKQQNISISIGHTNATYGQTIEAINCGATQVTHTFNAMNSFSHREVGVIGATLLNENLKAELICDGVHVSEEAIKLLYKCKSKENIILISDSMRAKGNSQNSKSELGGQEVFINNGVARLKDGTLAGSVLRLIDGVKNMMKFTGCSLNEAIYMASTNPAKNLNIYDKKGSIKIGKDADLVILDENLEIYQAIVNGEIKYRRELK